MYEVKDVDFSYSLVSIPKGKVPAIEMYSGKFRLGLWKEKTVTLQKLPSCVKSYENVVYH